MTFKEIYENFTPSSKENFPAIDCTVKNNRNKKVFDSCTPYLCLIIDNRFKDYWEIAVLYPYIYKESKELTTFGWVDKDGNVKGNIENSVQLFDDFVVGFQKYDDSGYEQLWYSFMKKIELQYEG